MVEVVASRGWSRLLETSAYAARHIGVEADAATLYAAIPCLAAAGSHTRLIESIIRVRGWVTLLSKAGSGAIIIEL